MSMQPSKAFLGNWYRSFVASAALFAGIALACAPVPPKGASVSMGHEAALIIWDAASKTEHFIRRAAFETDAADFGFLVPTPTQPELAEVDDELFTHLAELTAPRIIYEPTRMTGEAWPAPAAAPAPAPPVTVLERRKISGYEAVILGANDAAALNGWLEKNGYPAGPELIDWFKPYVDNGWKITAFKIARDGNGMMAEAKAVRMSFRADAPFYPYREPVPGGGAKPSSSRLLSAFVLASDRVQGRLGHEAGAVPWQVKTEWSNRVDERALEAILKHARVAPSGMRGAAWLTEFTDRATTRLGTSDLYFGRSADQSSIERPPIVRVGRDPADDMLIAIGVIGAIFVAFIGLLFFSGRWLYRFLHRMKRQ